jgi:DNA helicase-2/ATP-dependent DNA helicase PcrA
LSEIWTDDLELDPEQRAAVEAEERAIAVLAGPGSGKTRVLSYRARHLLAKNPGARALLLTFTNKAAAEMKARSLDVSCVTTDHILGCTFHSFAIRLLRAHGNLVGLGEFEILDDTERQELIREAAIQAGTRDRFNRWSYLRLRLYEAREQEVIRFAEAYQKLKSDRHVLDFDDLIVLAASLLEENEQVAEAIATRRPHLLVDEFQDTNPAQFAILQALYKHAQTVSVFADDDQAIYQFAGAEPRNIRRFIDDLEAQRYPLLTNYRCRKKIVARANRLITSDEEGSGRQMKAHYDGGVVASRAFLDVDSEADALGEEIARLIREERVQPMEIAVLSRRKKRLEAVLAQLENLGIPVSNWLGPSFEADERQALATCLSVAKGSLNERQRRRLCDLLEVAANEETDPEKILRACGSSAAALLLEVRELVWSGAPVIEVVAKARSAIAEVDEGLAEQIGGIEEAVEAFQRYDADFGIEHLLAELALGGVHGSPTAGGGVKIASLHRAKGLQWPHVYLVGMEDGVLPDFRCNTPAEFREERRACFVGVSRAEQCLTLSRVNTMYGRHQDPSCFLAEMGFSSEGD